MKFMQETDVKPVSFCIPLASKTDVRGWKRVNECLGYTLRSILRQTDPRFSVYVCSHDKPQCEEMCDPRVSFVAVKGRRASSPDEFIRDKAMKRKALAEIVKSNGPSYMVMHDGDDILSRRLVEYFRAVNDPHGYTYPVGYVMDFQACRLAPVPGVWGKPFSHVCGSSAAIWMTPSDFDEEIDGSGIRKESYFRRFKQHSGWPEVARAAGRPLHEVPFPCCIYVQNNSINISAQLQRSEERIAHLMQTVRERSLEMTAELVAEFSLDWVWHRVRSTPRPREVLIDATGGNERARQVIYQLDSMRLGVLGGISDDAELSNAQRRDDSRELADVVAEMTAKLRPAVVLEVGAGRGYFSRRVKSASPETRVIAAEGSPTVHAENESQLATLGVESVQTCITDHQGVVAFHVPVHGGKPQLERGSTLLNARADQHESAMQRAETVDSVLAAKDGSVVLWIDAEGATLSALAGARATLERCILLYATMEVGVRWQNGPLAHDVLAFLAETDLIPVLTDVRRPWQFGAVFCRSREFGDPGVARICVEFLERRAARLGS